MKGECFAMKLNLKGAIAHSGATREYKYVLNEMYCNLQLVAEGRATFAQFCDLYCITPFTPSRAEPVPARAGSDQTGSIGTADPTPPAGT